MDRQKTFDQLTDLIRDIFPNDAELNKTQDHHKCTYKLSISWKLNDDPNRPNKSSKIILIVITDEALDDYFSSTTKNQQEAQNRFKKYIEEKYKNFDPSHNMPKYQPPPNEEWLIKSDFLNK